MLSNYESFNFLLNGPLRALLLRGRCRSGPMLIIMRLRPWRSMRNWQQEEVPSVSNTTFYGGDSSTQWAVNCALRTSDEKISPNSFVQKMRLSFSQTMCICLVCPILLSSRLLLFVLMCARLRQRSNLVHSRSVDEPIDQPRQFVVRGKPEECYPQII